MKTKMSASLRIGTTICSKIANETASYNRLVPTIIWINSKRIRKTILFE